MSDIAALPGTALMKSGSTPHAALAPPHMLQYAMKRYAVQAAWVARAVQSSVATAKLFASGRALGSSVEILQMQHAVLKQLNEMGQDWLRGLDAWTKECTEIKAANTMSKIVEQEFDLIGQFGQLLSDQVTDLVNLMERVQVGYGYWVQQKLEA